jgi:hypothetical protein
MDVSIIDEKGLSQYFAMTILPRQAYSSLYAWPWISRILLLIGNGIPSRDIVG